MILDDKFYVPTLAVRPGEMKGLEFLSAAAKNRMLPCFLLAPWVSSRSLERTLTRIERAFHKRHYILDIDSNYSSLNKDSIPLQELERLKEPANFYSNWLSFVEKSPWVYPCIQYNSQGEVEIRKQIESYQNVRRPYCLRIVHGHEEGVSEAISAVAASGAADFAIILEGGWTDDPLSLSLWFDGFIANGLRTVDARVPIVVSYTTMPKMFSDFSGKQPVQVSFDNRQLVRQITRNTNRTRIIYGDWGSTRPRADSGFASRPLDRIDYPTNQSWWIARNKEDKWTFRDAAKALIKSEAWDDSLDIWGVEQIRNTAINEELGISSASTNVSSRVNIHLYRQAIYDSPGGSISSDEEWVD